MKKSLANQVAQPAPLKSSTHSNSSITKKQRQSGTNNYLNQDYKDADETRSVNYVGGPFQGESKQTPIEVVKLETFYPCIDDVKLKPRQNTLLERAKN